METTITKKITGNKMLKIFEDGNINIRHFQARNFVQGMDIDKIYTYDIGIRHNENENPEELFNDALSVLFPSRDELLKKLSTDHKAELISDMQDWIKDCQWEDLEEWQVDAMTDEELFRGIELHYSGGLQQFIEDNQY